MMAVGASWKLEYYLVHALPFYAAIAGIVGWWFWTSPQKSRRLIAATLLGAYFVVQLGVFAQELIKKKEPVERSATVEIPIFNPLPGIPAQQGHKSTSGSAPPQDPCPPRYANTDPDLPTTAACTKPVPLPRGKQS